MMANAHTAPEKYQALPCPSLTAHTSESAWRIVSTSPFTFHILFHLIPHSVSLTACNAVCNLRNTLFAVHKHTGSTDMPLPCQAFDKTQNISHSNQTYVVLTCRWTWMSGSTDFSKFIIYWAFHLEMFSFVISCCIMLRSGLYDFHSSMESDLKHYYKTTKAIFRFP